MKNVQIISLLDLEEILTATAYGSVVFFRFHHILEVKIHFYSESEHWVMTCNVRETKNEESLALLPAYSPA